VGRADTILAQGAEALEAKEYAKVRGFAKDAHDAVREASLLKTVREAFASLQLDAADIRTMGAEVTNFEGMLVELGKAIEGNDLPTARRLVSQARHRAESTRETHFRTIMERSLQIILANATRRLDPVVARQLPWTASSTTSPRPASRSGARRRRSSDRPGGKSPERKRTASPSTPPTRCSRTPRPRIPRPATATRSTRGRRASPRWRSWPRRTGTRSDSPSRRRRGSG